MSATPLAASVPLDAFYTRGAALPALLKALQARRSRVSRRALRFPRDIKGNNELLSITQPQIIREIHDQYFAAGADIVETNTFGATTVAQSDYEMEDLVVEMNIESAKLAREAAEKYATPEKPRFVAGAIADAENGQHLAGRQRPGRTQRHVRRAARVVLPAGEGAARRRRRPVPRRDDLRHAEREGCAVRARRAVRGHRRAPADHDLGHRHRCVGPDPVGPDGRGVLEFAAPCEAAHVRPELRARRGADAPYIAGSRSCATRTCRAIRTRACRTRWPRRASTRRRTSRRAS